MSGRAQTLSMAAPMRCVSTLTPAGSATSRSAKSTVTATGSSSATAGVAKPLARAAARTVTIALRMAVFLMVRFSRLSGVIQLLLSTGLCVAPLVCANAKRASAVAGFATRLAPAASHERRQRPVATRSAGRGSELQYEPEFETAEPDVIRRDPGAFASQHRVAVERGERRDGIGVEAESAPREQAHAAAQVDDDRRATPGERAETVVALAEAVREPRCIGTEVDRIDLDEVEVTPAVREAAGGRELYRDVRRHLAADAAEQADRGAHFLERELPKVAEIEVETAGGRARDPALHQVIGLGPRDLGEHVEPEPELGSLEQFAGVRGANGAVCAAAKADIADRGKIAADIV